MRKDTKNKREEGARKISLNFEFPPFCMFSLLETIPQGSNHSAVTQCGQNVKNMVDPAKNFSDKPPLIDAVTAKPRIWSFSSCVWSLYIVYLLGALNMTFQIKNANLH